MTDNSKKKPLIAVTPVYDAQEERYVLKGAYTQMLEELGALTVIVPLTADEDALDRYLDLCDGILLSGGADIDPVHYGDVNEGLCGSISPLRDEAELVLCRKAVERDMPVLGICRGHQVLNVALGGTLYQDLKVQQGTTFQHAVLNPLGGMVHGVSIVPGSPLAELQGVESMMVNSRHHQAIRDVAPGLVIQASSPDGVIESVYLPGKRFVWGVQWHPESVWTISEENRKIAAAFVRAAKGENR